MLKKEMFGYILLETTGLADLGPITAMFWMDAELGSDIYTWVVFPPLPSCSVSPSLVSSSITSMAALVETLWSRYHSGGRRGMHWVEGEPIHVALIDH